MMGDGSTISPILSIFVSTLTFLLSPALQGKAKVKSYYERKGKPASVMQPDLLMNVIFDPNQCFITFKT